MSPFRFALGMVAAGVVLAVLAVGCGGEDSGTSAATAGGAGAERPPEADVSGVRCPEEIRISDRPRCKLIAQRVKLIDCPRAPVGHHVRVSGISCSEAYGFLSPLGAAAGIHFFQEARQKLTRPAVATYHPPFEVRDTGWTCWAAYSPKLPYGTQFVCWRGSDVLTFRFSG